MSARGKAVLKPWINKKACAKIKKDLQAETAGIQKKAELMRKRGLMKQYETSHLVAGKDLNHHGTLFAAQAAAWFVEAAFIAAGCSFGDNEIVCRNINEMSFHKPVQKGTILRFTARIVLAGKTSFMAAVQATDALSGEKAIEGFVTFVTIEESTGNKKEHYLVLDEAAEEEEKRLRNKAEMLRSREAGQKHE